MKILTIWIWLLVFWPPQPGGYRLTVTVHNIKPLKGELYVALHQRAEFFSIPDSALMKSRVTVDAESETVTFRNVPAGKYALAVYQDENLNGVMDVNEIGIPREGYAFSGKQKGPGKPKFEECVFEMAGNDTISLKMVYHPVPPPKKEGNK
jgi:uncharacterized protein (DUF2141 family)